MKIANFFLCVWITIVMWTICRFASSLISILIPNSFVLQLVIPLIMLFLGWLAANRISKGHHPNCIKVNLFIFMLLEIPGLNEVMKMLRDLTFSTGRFTTDVYGVPYSQYPIRILIFLAYLGAYVGLCLFLNKKSTRLESEEDN